MYPMKIKASKEFIEELVNCEMGRYEDAEYAREINDIEEIKECNYDCVFIDFSGRWKTQIEVKNDSELRELYYVCASGTIGLYGYTKQANKILNKIRKDVQKIDPDLVKLWPKQERA
jgi:hypothetical protein